MGVASNLCFESWCMHIFSIKHPLQSENVITTRCSWQAMGHLDEFWVEPLGTVAENTGGWKTGLYYSLAWPNGMSGALVEINFLDYYS